VKQVKTFIIRSDYEYEVEANDADEAIEKWGMDIADELATENMTIEAEFADSLYAKEFSLVDKVKENEQDLSMYIGALIAGFLIGMAIFFLIGLL
jgi:hypothetical protein